MTAAPSLGLRLYGTEEPPAQARRLAAGPLTALLERGGLRDISLGGREALRGIAYVLRDRNWATYTPAIEDLDIRQDSRGFVVTYAATCGDAEQSLRYRARIEGAGDGTLDFSVEATPLTDWTTNRTGFAVLHGVEGIAGRPVEIAHTDGSVSATRFPDLISPGQPFFDIRSMTHEVAPGVTVTCTMEGGAYECEDQRNWSDGSFKTYIRPLGDPRPYVMEAGRPDRQRVRLTIAGRPPAATAGDGTVAVSVAERIVGAVPRIALALAPEDSAPAADVAELVRRAGPQALFCHFDPGRGHDAGDIARFAGLGEAMGAELVLEAVLPLQDASGDFTDADGVLEADVERLARMAAGVAFARVSASPRAYRASYQPTETWPRVPALETVYGRLRRAFPEAAIGGGMHGYFTELNRKRPPADALDFITHTTAAVVHAGDDRSVMETLQALPSIMRSARAMAPGKPYWIGPSAIGMRFNPYGAATMPNPGNRRVAMATMDPRQRGLFNAAWTLGYAAHAARFGVEGVCLGAPAGAFGIAHARAAWHQPWFDDDGAAGLVYPVYHVIRDLARHGGRPVREARSSASERVVALAVDETRGSRSRGPVLWLANLTAREQTVRVAGLGAAGVEAARIDAESFERLCRDPEGFAGSGEPVDPAAVMLGAYAVCRLAAPGRGRAGQER